MRKQGQLREDIDDIEDMNYRERDLYTSQINRYKQMNFASCDDVKKVILRDLSYKQMQIVNPEILETLDSGAVASEDNKIYVFAQFFKPGKGVFTTCVLDEDQDL